MARQQYLEFGFFSTLGGFGAMALMGLLALVGIVMVMSSKDSKTGERNTPLLVSGIVLIVIAALPVLPYFGLSLAFDQLFDE